MCGKNYKRLKTCMYHLGSPPHVREKPRVVRKDWKQTRITPACAGKTRSRISPSFKERDHPRMCGKNSPFIVPKTTFPGSPPHVREKLDQLNLAVSFNGITPACAGKTQMQINRHNSFRDHPRMCGKNVLTSLESTGVPGSPPHVREKQIRWTSEN